VVNFLVADVVADVVVVVVITVVVALNLISYDTADDKMNAWLDLWFSDETKQAMDEFQKALLQRNK